VPVAPRGGWRATAGRDDPGAYRLVPAPGDRDEGPPPRRASADRETESLRVGLGDDALDRDRLGEDAAGRALAAGVVGVAVRAEERLEVRRAEAAPPAPGEGARPERLGA